VKFKLLIIIVLGLALPLLQSCSSIISATTSEPFEEDRGERSSGSFIDDEIIETKALVNIDKADPQLAQSHISVVSYNRVVLLAGQVANENLRQLAAEAVNKIGGLKRVHNEITVAGATSMVARSNDSWITSKIKTKMLADGDLESSRIKIVTENGVVYLMGLVTRNEGNQAADIASKTAGVQKVVRIFEYI
jgi:osmotically-inducible protein OsmY